MKLQALLTSNLNQLKPKALILIQRQNQYSIQKVFYQPEVLHLGVILIGYYHSPERIMQLSKLGDCLSVGHYLRSPRTLKYGRDFAENSAFQKLPAKLQKHLTGEIQDCCISFSRDLGRDVKPVMTTEPVNILNKLTQVKFVYLYQDHVWQLARDNGRTLNKPVNLRDQINSRLKKA